MSESFRETVSAAERAVTGEDISVAAHVNRLISNPADVQSGTDEERAYLAVLLDFIGLREESARILEGFPAPEQVSASAVLRNVEGMLAAAHGDYGRARRILGEALQAAGDSPVLRVKIQANLAAVSWGAGAPEVAEAWADAASAQQEGRTPASDVLIASVRAWIASVRGDLQGLQSASASLGVASRARIEELGANHPQALATVSNMAHIQVLLARAEDSQVRLERAIDVLEVTAFRVAAELGADHPLAIAVEASLYASEFGQPYAGDLERQIREADAAGAQTQPLAEGAAERRAAPSEFRRHHPTSVADPGRLAGIEGSDVRPDAGGRGTGPILTTSGRATDLPQTPATIADEQIGVNSIIAAALTRSLGSMPALYVALVVIIGWMALATWGPLHRVDPYPFPFLLFLNNAVQLILCVVILVDQRLLGSAADRRAVQTYENAEAIFEQVVDLQEHLDRHDRALSRGVSLLEWSPHPWIERHRVQPPPQAIDQAVTVNGRIAARLAKRLGTMGVLYLAAGTQVAWIVLAEVGIQRFDRYPFLFMSFLSAVAQLVLMIVIIAGQDVLSRAGDRRSEQTFLDAKAILHECRRMKARLTTQDRVLVSLTSYVTVQVTEHLAQAIHDDYRTIHTSSSLGPWDELPEEFKESNRAQARQIGEKLAVIGCLMVPIFDPTLEFTFDDGELQLLARLEHERWMQERTAQGFELGPTRYGRMRPDLVPWERLSDEARARNIQAVRRIPEMLARVGFQVLRNSGSP
jgi:uncharacterized membrane protein